MVILLITLVTPLMSVTSLVTKLFSASFLAMPTTVTTTEHLLSPELVTRAVRVTVVGCGGTGVGKRPGCG